ncbi:MAG: oxidoreductase [Bacteroidia bacterium]|nr:oxidoreductase [Bacteroidia bacterium]
MSNKKWSNQNINDLSGKVVIVTGGNSGLGYESSKALASKGATVIVASRKLERAGQAVEKLKTEVPGGQFELMKLDLSSLDSVREFVAEFSVKYEKLDILMNNAGIMAVPAGKTKDGFESQLGVNHLGHFALTGLLLDKLEAAESSRVVNVASLAADNGSINFDDLMSEKDYSKFGAYSQSKLANILFTQELNERLEKAGFSTRSMVAHPGGSKTNLAEGSDFSPFMKFLANGLFSIIAQPAWKGALPQLYAATEPQAEAGAYYGPDGFNEFSGYPKKAKLPQSAQNLNAQRKLWDVSEELTGISYLSN